MSIQYAAAKNEMIEQHIETNQCVVHQSPRFKVQYSFNPPDDSDDKDLIHEIMINESPETFLKAGDPLPILYRIYRDSDDVEHVESMPFPIVLKDAESLSGLVGSSTYHQAKEA